MNEVRQLGALERVWMAADHMAPPFVISCVIEGVGTLTIQTLQASVDSVITRHPWLCAKLIGALTTCRWESSGNPPAVTEFSVYDWDGVEKISAIPWHSRLSPVRGDTLSVWLIRSDVTRIIFRAAHAFMDGKALLAFASAVGEGLHGTHTKTLTNASLTDLAAARMTGAIPKGQNTKSRHPFQRGPTSSVGTLWRRRRLPLPSGHLLARVIVALKTYAASTEPFVVEIPVNLRAALGLSNETGNLTGLLRLPITDSRPVEVHESIMKAISENKHLAPILSSHRFRLLPISSLAQIGRAAHRKEVKTQHYSVGATVSNLGLTDLSSFSGPSFQPTACYWIPPHSPSNPLLLIMCGSGAHLEITASAPCALGDNGRLDRLLDHIVYYLTSTAPS